MNYVKTTMLMVVLSMLLVLIGSFLPIQGGVYIFFMISLVMNFVMYWYSDKITLAMYSAKPLTQEQAPEIFRALNELTQRAQIPMPKVYLIPTETPNAFATGRNPSHAAVAVTEGIMRLLNYEELKGVLAHELSHVKNRDTLISTLAASMAGAIMMLARIAGWSAMFGGFGGRDREGNNNIIGLLVMVILAPLAAMLIQMAISRSREYGADATGARLVGNSFGLSNALLKLEQAAKVIPMNASPATSHLFIVNPLSGKSLMNLFSTHPPVEERVRRLRELAL